MKAQQALTNIFNTIPSHDYLGFFKEDHAPKKVVDFLDFTKGDVEKATNIPKASIRYDEKIPKELMVRLREIGIICELVADYFKGDLKKTALWFQIKNPALGNISPRDMILYGRYRKLEKFIQSAFAGNMP
jgi:hypothetical protein